jgi:hypothetical protein
LAKIFDIVLMVGGAAALWYAYKKGYLEDILGELGNIGGGGGGVAEPEPAPAEEAKGKDKAKEIKEEVDKKVEDAKKKADSKKKSKSKLALALVGTHYDGTFLDKAYTVTQTSSFIPLTSRNTIGVAIA